jgi:hypothetical protein
MNPEDQKRDAILRFLYERHKSSRGIAKIPIGIRDLQSEMKERAGMSQQDVASNLDYLVQVGWAKEVAKERTFKTSRGMEVSQEQIKYKISDVGINHLEGATVFKRPEASRHVNITNVKGVTIVGDGNVVNASFTDLARALDDLDAAVAESPAVPDEVKVDVAGDLTTIRGQIAKAAPNKSIVAAAWKSLSRLADVATLGELIVKVGLLLGPLIS